MRGVASLESDDRVPSLLSEQYPRLLRRERVVRVVAVVRLDRGLELPGDGPAAPLEGLRDPGMGLVLRPEDLPRVLLLGYLEAPLVLHDCDRVSRLVYEQDLVAGAEPAVA